MVTAAGYLQFIRSIMGITSAQLPDNDPSVSLSLQMAVEIINPDLQAISVFIADQATYNLAADYLINIAQDQPGQKFFSDLRLRWNIFGFVPGVVSGSNDESTGQTLMNPEFMKNFSLANLQNLKSPYGRQYLAYAQSYGTMWGIS